MFVSGPSGTPYEGGVFPALLTFPKDYPLSPPSMKFTCDLFHPNSKWIIFEARFNNRFYKFLVYPDGRVCISILHPPGDDPNQYESSSERWSPVQSIEKILLSVVSMLAGKKNKPNFKDPFCNTLYLYKCIYILEPNDESGANIDACKLWRSDREAFNAIVRENVRKSLGIEN